MRLFLLICSLVTVAVAQEPSLSCIYYNFGPTNYHCQLTIDNPNGFDNFTEIGGIHLEGFSNEDVDVLYIARGISSNVPQIICETFPNLFEFDFFNARLTELDDNSFSGCSQLGRLYLSYNRISSISENAFANLRAVSYIHLGDNLLTTLPENVFANQQNVTDLILSYNAFTEIPTGLFRPLENLQNLYIGGANLTTVNNQWFTENSRLTYLYLGGNRITLSANMFSGIEGLRAISLALNEITEIPPGTFAGLPSLQTLDLYWNAFTSLREDSFPGLGQLVNIDLSRNPIDTIEENAFRGLAGLQSLALENCRISDLDTISLNLPNLTYLDLNFNAIEEIPIGFFESMPNLFYIGLWANRIKTLRRNSFGSLSALSTFDLDGNIVNAIDRAFIDDAVNLNTLYFDGNLCASNYFGNFLNSRDRYLPMLERCFRNMRYIVETTTENDGVYSFFEGPEPGIVLRVRSDNEVQIALTPFNFIWTPSIEIFIGSANNTRSVIRINDETDVVTVPTPNVIQQNQWNDFRVSWANQNVLVFNSNDTFPFMSYTMQHFYPVNFYGLRAVETRATWSVQPIFIEDN
ncbi:leucine-rich repeat-containing protein 15-like [Bradysia coprophila]|uniref:leucine-rich repeat-containing protein 15-like n=1 Tax=Bradysia coprophila TaxID=38358 RepID=UPI00187DBD91|nr:leucine-rich repeat-containing protein 15-like [Bradysia coprophila]